MSVTMVRRKRSSIAVMAAVMAAALSVAGLATAGTSADPEITDVAGDANWINGQGLQPGHEEGPDTRPASFDNVDLRAVWFETAYSTTKVRDSRGAVLRVEHRPTALVIRIQTQGPTRPLSPWTTIRYYVRATLSDCKARFELAVFSNSNEEEASIRHDHPWYYFPGGGYSPPCGNLDIGNDLAVSPVRPTFEGTVATLTFPFSDTGSPHQYDANVSQYISNGPTISQPAAFAQPSFGLSEWVDEMAPGRNFTIGQDVPPDVDCTDDPENPECSP